MSENEKSFTVRDRRHFTEDGRPREEAEAPGATEPGSVPHTEKTKDAPGQATQPPPRSPHGAEARGPADFGQFLLSLGAQAGALLTGRGLPEGADSGQAREGARAIISILEMLKDKTGGHRTPAEDEILEGLLFDLRMAYVEKTRTEGR
jgi:hypothetical protein